MRGLYVKTEVPDFDAENLISLFKTKTKSSRPKFSHLSADIDKQNIFSKLKSIKAICGQNTDFQLKN